jgi:hypothetical protein
VMTMPSAVRSEVLARRWVRQARRRERREYESRCGDHRKCSGPCERTEGYS